MPEPTDLAELFARDPEHLTRQDIRDIIDHFRQARSQFNLGAQQAGSPKALKRPKGGPKLTNLDDLALDL